MAHYLAVDWDATELRLVLALSHRGSIRILKAESAPLEFDDSPDGTQKADIGLTLKQLVKRHRVSGATLLLGLNRASVDMMTFRLPKSKPEELPDLVINQALRDSPGFTENSPIDFITCPAADGDYLRTIAATVSRQQLKYFRSLCQTAGFRPKRIEFRPLALAGLYWNSIPASDKPVLLVQCTQSEVDMVVVDDSHVVSVRSIKLPESLTDEERTSRIVAEIARTIAVSRQEVEGAALEKVIVYGIPDEFQTLQERLTDQEIETVIQNPFQLPCIVAPAKANITGASENPGHYASLFGMILSEQSKAAPRIDFLHPHEKPRPFNIARFVVLFLLLVGIVGFVAYRWNNQQLAQLDEHLAGLNAEIEKLQKDYWENNPRYTQLYNAWTWEGRQMNWLDELRDVSLRLPAEQDMVIDQMQFVIFDPNQNYPRGAFVIKMLARVRDVSVIYQIRSRFNDGAHTVVINNQLRNQWGGGYPFSCSISIFVTKRDYASYWQHLTPELRQQSLQMPAFPQTWVTQAPAVTTPETVVTPTDEQPPEEVQDNAQEENPPDEDVTDEDVPVEETPDTETNTEEGGEE